MMRYALLSGEHPSMPLGELEALLEVLDPEARIIEAYDGLAVYESSVKGWEITSRAGWIKEAGILIYIGEAAWGPERLAAEIHEALVSLGVDKPLRVEARRYKQYAPGLSIDLLKKKLIGLLEERGPGASTRARSTLRVFATEGIVSAGLVEDVLDTRAFDRRRPGRRPFFKPGPLSPQLSRVLANLSRPRPGGVFMDPFCGTGGIALEACLAWGGRVLCGDVAWDMVRGASRNLPAYGCNTCLVMAHNVVKPPVAGMVDAIATDPPYGRSTTTSGHSYETLAGALIDLALQALPRGGHLVYAGPHSRRPYAIAEEAGLRVRARYHMHVHGTLTREVVVAQRV